MKLSPKKLIGLSLCTAFLLHTNLLADEKKQTQSLEDVDVIATDSNITEGTGSYTTGSMNTSAKLNLSIKDTPQSISVLTNENLTDFGIDSFQELLYNVSGVSIDRTDERINPSARGFTIDYYKIDGAPIYVDYSAHDIDMSIYDRVEIVRGANGLTTGAGNPGIGMNFIRKKAKSKELKADITLEAGSWDAYSATADIGAALNEEGNIRGRIIAKHLDADSFMDQYEKTQDTIYGTIDMDLSDSTYLSFGASYQKLDRSGIRWGGLPAFYSDGTRTDFDRSLTFTEDWTFRNEEANSAFANFEHIFKNDITLNASYSYEKTDGETALFYYFGKPNKVNGSGGFAYAWEDVTEDTMHNFDINLDIPFELGGLNHEVILGASYNVDKKIYLKAIQPFAGDPVNFFNYDVARGTTGTAYASDDIENTQKALYLAGKFSLTNYLKLIAGTRFSSFERDFLNTNKETNKSDNILPYVGLVFDLDDNHSLYTSYTSIFKPQNNQDKNADYLDPIEGDSLEAGIKGEYFDGALNASFGVFKINQDNAAQADGKQLVNTSADAYKAVEGVTSKGFEIDINGSPTDNLNINFSLANFRAKDKDGKKFNTDASRTTANLYTTYKMDKLTFGGGLQYKSEFYTGSGSSLITQDAYVLANAMLKYKVNKHTQLQLNVNNIFDKKYYDGIGSDTMNYGDPRNFKVALKYTF